MSVSQVTTVAYKTINSQVLKPALAASNFAVFSRSLLEPRPKISSNHYQLLVDDSTKILWAHNHFGFLVLTLFARHELGVEGEEQTLLANVGERYTGQ